jgi:hypothetical protein
MIPMKAIVMNQCVASVSGLRPVSASLSFGDKQSEQRQTMIINPMQYLYVEIESSKKRYKDRRLLHRQQRKI